jgi:uncharacterized protein (DUF4213/DUF364 family)
MLLPRDGLNDIYEKLIEKVPETAVRWVVVGLNWTLVATDGGCGLAQTPPRDTPGCRAVPEAGALQAETLDRLAKRVNAENPSESVIGMAAINAHFNRYDLQGSDENGLAAFAGVAGPVAVVGRFPGLEHHLVEPRVIERHPKENEYPEANAPQVIADCDAVIITASAFGNHSLPALLELAQGKRTALVGPGTPLTPMLHDLGVEVLAGTIVTDIEGAATAMAQGGAVQALRPHSRFVTLRESRP